MSGALLRFFCKECALWHRAFITALGVDGSEGHVRLREWFHRQIGRIAPHSGGQEGDTCKDGERLGSGEPSDPWTVRRDCPALRSFAS